MSERGSFVTEYIHCEKCFAVVRDVLVSNEKYLKGIVIPSWADDGGLPIVAGKIGGLGPNDELITMEYEQGAILDERLCHPVRVAVLADSGESKVFTFGPSKEDG